MAILSELPPPPPAVLLDEAQHQFSLSFKHHIFLNAIAIPPPSARKIVPPYLKIAFACLGVAASDQSANRIGSNLHTAEFTLLSASDLFITGESLWGVMMEVDNREARLLESIFAVRGPLLPTIFSVVYPFSEIS